jgi:hypothetical protein
MALTAVSEGGSRRGVFVLVRDGEKWCQLEVEVEVELQLEVQLELELQL